MAFNLGSMTSAVSLFSSPVVTPLQQQQPGWGRGEGRILDTCDNNKGGIVTEINMSMSGNNGRSVSSTSAPSSSSVGLCCLSADALSVHRLDLKGGAIVSHFLPVSNDGDEEEEEESGKRWRDGIGGEASMVSASNNGDSEGHGASKTKSVRTALPEYVVSLLGVDPPLELICIDNDTASGTCRPVAGSSGGRRKKLPLVCLYTARSAFVVEMSFPWEGGGQCLGRIESIYEPFECFLNNDQATSSSGTCILRIRAAPNSHLHGGNVYGTLCPKGAMAMLTDGGDLVLYHGHAAAQEGRPPPQPEIDLEKKVSLALTVQTEDLAEADPVVDFGFVASAESSAPSNASNAVWNAMAVVLASAGGELYAASPVVFDGTLVPRTDVLCGLGYLQDVLDYEMRALRGAHRRDSGYTARWKTAKAATQFFKDVFGLSSADSDEHSAGTSNYYAIARTQHHAGLHLRSAARWPLRLQGPLYRQHRHTADTDRPYAPVVACLEVMPPPPPLHRIDAIPRTDRTPDEAVLGGSTVGVVLARGTSELDYVFVPSGTALLPRFAYESGDDRDALDALLQDSSLLAERVVFDDDLDPHASASAADDHEAQFLHTQEQRALAPFAGSRNSHNRRQVVLIPDPVDRTMVHHVSNRGVVAVSTNVATVVQRSLCATDHNAPPDSNKQTTQQQPQQQDDHTVRTTAWSSIEIPNGGTNSLALDGVVVSGDAQLGHVLVACLSNGQTEAVNITAAQYIRESNNIITAESQHTQQTEHNKITNPYNKTIDTDEALKMMESNPPLYKLIAPLFQQISDGLSGIGKLVGDDTTLPRDVTPGQVATFLSVKQQCEQDVVLPLRKLKDVVSTRQEYLADMQEHQLLQIQQLRSMLQTLKERNQVTDEKRVLLTENSDLLAHRSARVLNAARALTPTLTIAEQDYFKELKRYEACCKKWEDKLKILRIHSDRIRKDIKDGQLSCTVALDHSRMEQCRSLLKGQDTVLKRNEFTLQDTETAVANFMTANGLADEVQRKPLALILDHDNK